MAPLNAMTGGQVSPLIKQLEMINTWTLIKQGEG